MSPTRHEWWSGTDFDSADVQARVRHLDSSGQQHGGVVTGHRGGAVLVGLHDPDGIEIRLYADCQQKIQQTRGFVPLYHQ